MGRSVLKTEPQTFFLKSILKALICSLSRLKSKLDILYHKRLKSNLRQSGAFFLRKRKVETEISTYLLRLLALGLGSSSSKQSVKSTSFERYRKPKLTNIRTASNNHKVFTPNHHLSLLHSHSLLQLRLGSSS